MLGVLWHALAKTSRSQAVPVGNAAEKPATRKRIRGKLNSSSSCKEAQASSQPPRKQTSCGKSPPPTAALLHDTKVWGRLVTVFGIPVDVVTALFTGIAQFYGEQKSLELFNEKWFMDMSDRWLDLSSQIRAKAESLEQGDALAAILPEFKQHLFAITRCISANSKLVSNVAKTDEQRIQELGELGFIRHSSSGHANNCLIDSLIIVLDTAGFINEPTDRKAVCGDIRTLLIKDPALHPAAPDGRRDKHAFLEHSRHARTIITELMRRFWVQPFPTQGFELRVHARYDTEQSPADTVLVVPVAFGVEMVPSGESPIPLNLFNWTNNGLLGYHYDALESPH